MHIQLVGFYEASELFSGFPDLWDQLVDSDPDFSWGCNELSLVTVDAILNHMDCVGIEYDDAFTKRCEKVDNHFYIDLEN